MKKKLCRKCRVEESLQGDNAKNYFVPPVPRLSFTRSIPQSYRFHNAILPLQTQSYPLHTGTQSHPFHTQSHPFHTQSRLNSTRSGLFFSFTQSRFNLTRSRRQLLPSWPPRRRVHGTWVRSPGPSSHPAAECKFMIHNSKSNYIPSVTLGTELN